ncbi:MAG: NAD(+) synthase [Bacteroidia bacterium]|nr:NAD(+) synthase [Bacteroidia bacterium]MCX7652630.1 NAD(+) synthase [Bacteroidia bacterium]MDW8417017.1 NAD(+) synthase [Bacteroidia bacterium]
MRIGAASLRTTPLDWEGNRARIEQVLTEARLHGVEIVVFPELALSGYECGDFFWHPWTADAAWKSLQLLLPSTAGMVVAVGLPLDIHGKLYNAAAILSDGEIVGFALKRHLPYDSVFYEPRWFQPAPKRRLIEPKSQKPAGHALPFLWGEFILTVEICEDAWQPRRPLTFHRTHIALSLNASPFEMEKTVRRHRLAAESSYRYKCLYAYANLLGNEAGKLLYDGDSVISWGGEIITAAERFSYDDGKLIWADVPEEELRTAIRKSRLPLPSDPIPISRKSTTQTLKAAKDKPSSLAPRPSRWAELTEAIAMGLWDYLWKSRSRGFVISLSGGLDSAACAFLAKYALNKAKQTLPSEVYQARLSYMGGADPQVHTFYQATAQSSRETYERAKALAEALQLPLHRWDIQPIVESYEAMVEAWLGRALSWTEDDIARQNLQARVRVPGLWMAANLLGALLITTSNRSELSVGYSTMDGDSSGGLAPIAGVAKADLREWALWAAETFNLPPLREIAQATPTAELRPGGQADEEDLMPYPLLNTMEIHLVQKYLSPTSLKMRFPEQQDMVEKFLRLFRISQWKRERTAPGFHVDGHDMDPRSAARFPILHALK